MSKLRKKSRTRSSSTAGVSSRCGVSWDIIGHKKLLALLEKHVVNGPFHAYLFVGEMHLGKKTVARQFIKALQCQDKFKKPCAKCPSCFQAEAGTHPDIIIVEKEAPKATIQKDVEKGGEIKVDRIRGIKRVLSLKPHSSSYKICFIPEADKMNKEAANALLKILEEPLGNVIFILVAPHTRTLLPTIVSRTQIVKFFSVSRDVLLKALKEKTSVKKAEEIVALSGGKPGRALQILENPEIIDFYKNALKNILRIKNDDLTARFRKAEEMSKNLVEAEKILNIWLSFYRDLILYKSGNPTYLLNPNFQDELSRYAEKYSLEEIKEIIRSIVRTKELFIRNVNPRLSLESLFLKI